MASKNTNSIEQLDNSGLRELVTRWDILSEIGDNTMSVDVPNLGIAPIDSVSVGDIVSHANISGIVESVTLGDSNNYLGLKSLVVRYSDPYNYSVTGNYYKRVKFVFGKQDVDTIEEAIKDIKRTDIASAVFVDVSSLRIIKRNTPEYKNDIQKILDVIG